MIRDEEDRSNAFAIANTSRVNTYTAASRLNHVYESGVSRFGPAKSPVMSDRVKFARQGLKRSGQRRRWFRGSIVATRSSPLA